LPFARSNALHFAKALHLSLPRTFALLCQGPSPVAAKDLRLLLSLKIIIRLLHGREIAYLMILFLMPSYTLSSFTLSSYTLPSFTLSSCT
jgi:hypothetical protein